MPKYSGKCRSSYFFLYPLGHLGLAPENFLLILPLAQVIVITFLATEVTGAFATSSFAGTIGLSCVNLTLIVGAEKVKFSACNLMKPVDLFSKTETVAN